MFFPDVLLCRPALAVEARYFPRQSLPCARHEGELGSAVPPILHLGSRKR